MVIYYKYQILVNIKIPLYERFIAFLRGLSFQTLEPTYVLTNQLLFKYINSLIFTEIYFMNDKKNYSIKTPIAKLPKFEKTEGIILEVAKAVECIQGQPITTKSQTGSPYKSSAKAPTKPARGYGKPTKDIGALILGNEYGKIRNKGKVP